MAVRSDEEAGSSVVMSELNVPKDIAGNQLPLAHGPKCKHSKSTLSNLTELDSDSDIDINIGTDLSREAG